MSWLTRIALLAAFVGAAGPAAAQLTVVDPSNLAQNALQVQRSLEQLQTQIKQLEALTSRSGFESLGNSAAEQAARRVAPEVWDETLGRVAAGAALQAGPMAGRLEALRTLYGAVGAADWERARIDAASRAAAARGAASALLAEGVANEAYGQIARRIAGVERLIAAIGESQDLKSAADLTARIAAETTLAQLELSRLQASAAALAAQEANRREAARASMLRFLDGASAAERQPEVDLDIGPPPPGAAP